MISKKDFKRISEYAWEIPVSFWREMKVPARIYISEEMFSRVENAALQQLVNTACLPGLAERVLAMPDIHSGYGPPIGGVGAFGLSEGVISPGFVGYDQNCGVRILKSEYKKEKLASRLDKLASLMQKEVPSGLGRGRKSELSFSELDSILEGGVPELVRRGFGEKEDAERCEEKGKMEKAQASLISGRAKSRGKGQLGTLGSGNHFLEVQQVKEIFDPSVAAAFGLFENQVLVMIHTGSRGLGHQNCADYLKEVMPAFSKYGIDLPDKELACVPFDSSEGRRFFGAMSAACNFAWANRQMITHYVRKAWKEALGGKSGLSLLYDVAHNIAKMEEHEIGGQKKKLLVHRKGATRAFPPGHPELPEEYSSSGQPVLIPGSMGTSSYVCVGTEKSKEAFYTVNHGAGRTMSRHAAMRKISGREVLDVLAKKGIVVKCRSPRGIAEEAPLAYKDIDGVVETVHKAGLSRKVARLEPLAVIKGE